MLNYSVVDHEQIGQSLDFYKRRELARQVKHKIDYFIF